MRVVRKAEGANFINQSLYISTDWEMPVFQRFDLSRLAAMLS
jgi:hypothetical protein